MIIAERIMNIHSDFGLGHTNFTFTVTDNGSNMDQEFTEYEKAEQEPEVQGHHTAGCPFTW